MAKFSRDLDLLTSKITPTLFTLAAPIMLGALLQTCYTMTDMFWVGRLGDQSVAAVGTIGMLLWFTQGILTAPKVGGQIFTGQQLGAGSLSDAREYVTASLRLTLYISTFLALILLIFHSPILSIFALNEAVTQKAASDYLWVVSAFLPISALPLMCSALMTSSGNSKTPFMITALGLISNMILDPLLILVFKMGVAGAAIATILSQAMQLLCYYSICRTKDLYRGINIFKWRFGLNSKQILKLGIPSSILNVFYSGVAIAIARIVASFGDMAIAAQRIGINVESISYAGAEGFTLALSSMLAQNYGAKNFSRSKRIYKIGYTLIAIFSVFTTLILFFIGPDFATLFLSQPDAIRHGSSYLKILSISQIFMNVEIMVVGAFSALGNTIIPTIVVVICMLLRIPMALIFSAGPLEVSGIWWAITISTLLKGTILTLLFHFFKKKKLSDN